MIVIKSRNYWFFFKKQISVWFCDCLFSIKFQCCNFNCTKIQINYRRKFISIINEKRKAWSFWFWSTRSWLCPTFRWVGIKSSPQSSSSCATSTYSTSTPFESCEFGSTFSHNGDKKNWNSIALPISG